MTLEMHPSVHTAERANGGAGPIDLSRRRRRGVVVLLCGIVFLVREDTSMQITAVHTLLRQLGHRPDLRMSMWQPTAHTAVYIGLLLVGGVLVNRLGAKRVMIGGYLVYLTGFVLHLVFVSNAVALVVARAIVGAGAAAILPATLAMVVLVCPEGSERARVVIAWAGCASAGVVVTPLVSAVVLNQVFWPFVIVGVALGNLVLLVGAITVLPHVPADPESPVDGRWVFVLATSGTLLTIALHQAPQWGWTSWTFLLMLAAGAVLAVVAVWVRDDGSARQTWIVGTEPRVRLAVFALGISALALFGMVYLVIQYLQVLGGSVPLLAGVALFVPASIATVIGAKVGAAMQREGCVVAAVIVGATAIMDGLAIGLTAGEPGDLGYLVAMMTVTSLGCALVVGIAMEVVCAVGPVSRTGVHWGARLILVQLCGLLGTATVGVIVNNGYHAAFVVPADVLAIGGEGIGHDPIGDGVRAVTLMGGDVGAPLAVAVRNAFVTGYRDGLLALIGVVAIGVAAMLVAVVRARTPKSTAPNS